MKRLLTLTLALLLAVALVGVSGATKYAYAEGDGEEPAEAAEPVNPYVGLWQITAQQDGDEYVSLAEAKEKIYMDFLPSGAIHAVMYDGEDAEDDYLAYVVTGENALTLFEGDEPVPAVYDPETGVITATFVDDESTFMTFLQRVTAEPLPDLFALVDYSQEEQQFYGYQIRSEEQVLDLVEFLAIVDEDPSDYYCLTLQPDGTGHVQFGSEKMGGDIQWTETQIIAVGNEDKPAPYTLENGHILMNIDGTIMDFAPASEIEALMGVKAWELENSSAQIPEEMAGTWELTKCNAYGFELTPEQMDMTMTFILNFNGTAILYTNDAAPAGYRLSEKSEGIWTLSSGGIELFELQYDGETLTMGYMGVDMIFEKTED